MRIVKESIYSREEVLSVEIMLLKNDNIVLAKGFDESLKDFGAIRSFYENTNPANDTSVVSRKIEVIDYIVKNKTEDSVLVKYTLRKTTVFRV